MCVCSITDTDKVHASFVMQYGTVIVTFNALLGLQALPVHGKMIQKKHTQSLVTALADFQKVRCYFAGVTQTAAIILAITVAG